MCLVPSIAYLMPYKRGTQGQGHLIFRWDGHENRSKSCILFFLANVKAMDQRIKILNKMVKRLNKYQDEGGGFVLICNIIGHIVFVCFIIFLFGCVECILPLHFFCVAFEKCSPKELIFFLGCSDMLCR